VNIREGQELISMTGDTFLQTLRNEKKIGGRGSYLREKKNQREKGFNGGGRIS